MRYSTPTEHPFKISEDEQTYLATLLKAKLQAIPPFHIPSLTLSDILHSTARASNIPNIPSDIQLSFFLRNRHVINRYGGKPVKDEAKQSLKITRVIWFWRLDEARQFQRFHDTMRWNTAMFIALLTLHELDRNSNHQRSVEMGKDVAEQGRRDTPTPRGRSAPISAAARRFMTQYLAAVLEHHNTPLLFTARESFINTWKNSAWDVYTGFRGAQKKLLKNLMKRLNKDWEEELDVAEKIMGMEKFQRRVGRFVGCVIPQKRQQNVPAALSGGEVGRSERSGNVYTFDTSPHVSHDSRDETNELLDALRIPFNPQPKDKAEAHQGNQSYQVEDVQEVTDLRTAIDAVQTIRPRDMLPMLMYLFPAD